MYKLNKKKKEKLRKKRIKQIMNKASLFEEIREEISYYKQEVKITLDKCNQIWYNINREEGDMLYDFQIYEEPAENNIEKLNKLEKDIKNGKAD